MSRKILFIVNRLGGGGAERVLVTLANNFVVNNEVSICSFLPGKGYTISEKVKLISFSGNEGKLERVHKLRRLIKKEKPSVVIAFEYFVNMQTCLALLGCNQKLIVSERNDPKINGGRRGQKELRNLLYIRADRLVSQTLEAKEYFPNYIQRKATVIQNPLKEGLPEVFLKKREKYIVNFCRLEKQKNLPLLIDAFGDFSKKYPEFILKIYGNGSEKETLVEYIINKRLENRIFIYPEITNIHEAIIDASMFVSSSDYEGLSNSMVEAMAIGLPTICTDCPCGGARSIINDKINGLLVPVKNKQRLCSAMSEIASNDLLEYKLSNNALLIKGKLSVDKIVGQWEKIL